MITRKVDKNEHLAGFIYNWVKKIGEQVEELRVISWQEGDASGLPENIKVFYLPTNGNKFLKMVRLKILVWQNLKFADGLFCHQMPIYTIVAGPFFRLKGKKVVSWYMHRQIDWQVRLMEKIANVVLSASKESFRLPSKKLIITGHGIDVNIFQPAGKQPNDIFKIVSVGRISPTKDYESMIKAVDVLSDQGIKNIKLAIIGEAGLAEQKIYFENLKKMAAGMNLESRVEFLGPKPNIDIPAYLKESDLFINLSGTGSLDKAVLEAMACGCLVLTSNEAFAEILPADLMVEKDQPNKLAEKIKWLMELPEDKVNQLRQQLREEVVKNHNLDNLAKKIISQFEK
ncbi:MAG: hypothetical protein A3J65_04605 [Candidatus Buchananbacteria bacterium RIFCSPHIGHO2_02_FULL_45_11b]|uniref:Glycosyl transferase family 1 domain-containing protein n=2 Tax=Candidatus Buchananiibacteriota TaxID=1817903 RepID=A0A1G1YD59_9BACT|nr:MAG: hypothetical protein A3J65_04605 [Candidatus Buchananbacteria bacterium RIFCSPHIGHO2_02_FULL_45_11b]OGY58060.1 MAG: hypothetical protein A3H67_01170 [Candidatus Buchananbacteria bacterium RIFCSPLOWO2_02_FULL_46_11b]